MFDAKLISNNNTIISKYDDIFRNSTYPPTRIYAYPKPKNNFLVGFKVWRTPTSLRKTFAGRTEKLFQLKPMVFLQTKLGQYLWCFKKVILERCLGDVFK